MSATWNVPALGDGVAEGTVARLLVEPGQRVEAGTPLLEIETDKVVMELPAPADGVVEAWLIAPGQTLAEGTPFLRVTAADAAAASNEEGEPAEVAPGPVEASVAPPSGSDPVSVAPSAIGDPPTGGESDLAPAGPAARRLARELGVVLADVLGSGKRGRISKQDVKRHVRERAAAAAGPEAAPTAELPDLERYGAVERVALDGIGRAVAGNMQRAWREVPHAWVTRDIPIDAIAAARARLRARYPDLPLTMTAILAFALARVVREFPSFNAALDALTQELVLRRDVHLGVAVDTPRGLLVPVLREADRRSLGELAIELAALAAEARSGRLDPGRLRGGSLTLSNLGGLGASAMQPMVNWPEVAIVGVSASREELRLVEGELRSRTLLPLTLGFDHRVINGADAARLLARLDELLQEPLALAL